MNDIHNGPNHRNQLLSAKVDRLFSNSKTGFIATLVNKSILTMIQWHHVSHRVLSIWLAVMVLTTLVRAAMMRPYNCNQPSSARTYYWKNVFIAGTLISGISLGVA